MRGHDAVHGGERSPTDPHLGTDPLGAALGLGQPSPGEQSGSRTDLATMAVKEFPALATEDRVKKNLSP